jgi:hypothetical protein
MSWTSLLRAATGALGGLLVACGPMAGAGPTGGEPENTAPPVDALSDPAHPGLEGCAVGDVDATLEVAAAFRDSCHEMVICGGLSTQFSGGLVQVLVNAAAGTTGHPAGFEYAGEGRYRSGDTMLVTLHLPQATSFGRAGELIEFDLFDPNNYFVSATIEASASIDLTGETRTSLSIAFTEVGPAIELLGLGPRPASPITIDAEAIASTLGGIEMRQNIVVDDVQPDGTHVRYELASAGVPLGSLLEGGGVLPMELVNVDAVRPITGETLRVIDWGMQYTAGSTGTLDGTITFAVEGGAFPYTATFVYPHRRTPDVALACGAGS